MADGIGGPCKRCGVEAQPMIDFLLLLGGVVLGWVVSALYIRYLER